MQTGWSPWVPLRRSLLQARLSRPGKQPSHSGEELCASQRPRTLRSVVSLFLPDKPNCYSSTVELFARKSEVSFSSLNSQPSSQLRCCCPPAAGVSSGAAGAPSRPVPLIWENNTSSNMTAANPENAPGGESGLGEGCCPCLLPGQVACTPHQPAPEVGQAGV